jgi:hypothetical protein
MTAPCPQPQPTPKPRHPWPVKPPSRPSPWGPPAECEAATVQPYMARGGAGVMEPEDLYPKLSEVEL